MRIRAIGPLAALALLFVGAPRVEAQVNAELWEPVVISIPDGSIAAQPYDVDIVGTFTSPTSRVVTHWGYYAGNDSWAFRFLCDEVGTWTWEASSGNGSGGSRTVDFLDSGDNYQLTYDPQVDAASGSFECTASAHPGPLEPVNKRWRYRASGEYTSPMAYQTGFFFRNPTLYGHTAQSIVDWYTTHGATMLQTNLLILNRKGSDPYYFHTVEQGDRIYLDESSGDPAVPDITTFWLPTWDRMNEFFDVARESNLGALIRFYGDGSDGPGAAGISEGSADEFRLMRYTVARLAAYPTVVWETGIDIGEERSDSWIDDWIQWMLANDPWQHPVASRFGGGSGGVDSAFATHRSDGNTDVPPFPNMASTWRNESRSIFWTDHWRDNHSCSSPRGFWCVSLYGWEADGGDCAKMCEPNNRYHMRGMAWETAFVHGGAITGNRKSSLSGGVANFTYVELAGEIDPFEEGADIQLRNDFLKTLTDYGAMVPDESLTDGEVYAASTGAGEFMFFVLQSQDGDSFTADLSSASGTVTTARWYHTTNGSFQNVTDSVTNSQAVTLTPPDSADWALHIEFNGTSQAPAPPTDLRVD